MTVEDRVLFALVVCPDPGHSVEAHHGGEGAPAKLVLGPGHGHVVTALCVSHYRVLPDHQPIHRAVTQTHDGVPLLPLSAKHEKDELSL